MSPSRWFLASLPPLFLLGCGHSRETVVLTLDPVAPPRAVDASASSPVAIGTVEFPPAFDRLAVVRQRESGRLRVEDFARWGAPVDRIARSVLIQDLTARMPAGTVRSIGDPPDPRTLVLRVALSSIVERDGTLDVTASWSARADVQHGIAERTLQLSSPIARDDDPGMADALSRILGQIADDVAERLKGRR